MTSYPNIGIRTKAGAAIMTYSEYEKIQALQEQARRREIWERMEALRREVRASNPDITTEAQAIELAGQFTRDAIASLVKKGKIKFAPSALNSTATPRPAVDVCQSLALAAVTFPGSLA